MAESLKKNEKKKDDKDKHPHHSKKDKERQESHANPTSDPKRPRWETDPDSYDPSIGNE